MSMFQDKNTENRSDLRQSSPPRSRPSFMNKPRAVRLLCRHVNKRAQGLRNSRTPPMDIFCGYCNGKGHLETRCFAKFGRENVLKQSGN